MDPLEDSGASSLTVFRLDTRLDILCALSFGFSVKMYRHLYQERGIAGTRCSEKRAQENTLGLRKQQNKHKPGEKQEQGVVPFHLGGALNRHQGGHGWTTGVSQCV